jgi:hypothetical protein
LGFWGAILKNYNEKDIEKSYDCCQSRSIRHFCPEMEARIAAESAAKAKSLKF